MPADAGHSLKDSLYAHFARVGHAGSAPKRIEILDVLGDAERAVAGVAAQTASPLKNTSAHLRALREAGHLAAGLPGW